MPFGPHFQLGMATASDLHSKFLSSLVESGLMSLIGTMKARPNRLSEIQALRALAAALVAFGHCLDWSRAAGVTENPPAGWASLGACGVDLFFVISGFIIAKTAFGTQQAPEPGTFLLRRALRILPCYWLWSLIALGLCLLRGLPLEPQAILKTFVFFSTGDRESYAVPVLYAGWTLSYELLFYLSIGGMLLVRRRTIWAPLLLAAALAATAMLCTDAPIWLRMLVNPLWLEFGAGLLLWKLHRGLIRLPLPAGLLLLATGLLILSLSLPLAPDLADIQQTVGAISALSRVAYWGGGATLVFAGVLVCGARGTVPTGLLQALGDASYSWYLTQLLVIPIVAKLWIHFWPGSPWQPFTLVCLSCTAVFALAAWRLVERPLHERLLGLTTGDRAP